MNRRLVLVLCVSMVATAVAAIAPAMSGAAGRPLDSGTYGMRTNGAYLSQDRLQQYESEVGTSINWFVAMAGRRSAKDMKGSVYGQLRQKGAVLPTVSDRMNLVMTVPLAFGKETAKTDNGRRNIRAKLLETARGNWDDDFRTVAETLVEGGYPDAVIRLGHEFTGSWYPWSAQGNEDAYIAAYRRVHDIMAEVSPGFRFEWNAARNTFAEFGPPAYPGDRFVDVIGIDVYYEPWKGDKKSFDDGLWQRRYQSILETHRNFAMAHGKPVSYAEWANGGVDEPAFIRSMHDWFASLPKSGPGSLLYQSYFNATKAIYDLDNFPRSKRTFIQLFGGKGTRPAGSPADLIDGDSQPLVVDTGQDEPTTTTPSPSSGGGQDEDQPTPAPKPAPQPVPQPTPAPSTTVSAGSGGNQAVSITAPSAISAVRGEPVTIDIQSNAAGHRWWKRQGPGAITWTDRTASDVEAIFRKAGTYQVAVNARTGDDIARARVTVTVTEPTGSNTGGSGGTGSGSGSGSGGGGSPGGPPADSGSPRLEIRNASANEGSVMVFKLVLDAATDRDVVATVKTVGVTATSGRDYVSRQTEVIIPAGKTRGWVGVRIKTDSVRDPGEVLRLRLVELTGATAERNSARGTIR